MQVGDSYYLVGTGRLKGKGVIYRFSLEKQGMTACIAEKGVAYSDLAEQDGKLYYWARETRESHANDPPYGSTIRLHVMILPAKKPPC